MEVLFSTVKELVAIAETQNKPISEIMIEQEMLITKRSREEIIAQMDNNLTVMESAIEQGLQGVKSTSGLTGGDAVLIQQYIQVRKIPFRRPHFGCRQQSGCDE